jgi:hypothetical protein
MNYHYEVGTKFGFQHFETMKEALEHRQKFGGIVYIVFGLDRARIA